MADDRKDITKSKDFARAIREVRGFGKTALRTAKTGKRAGKARRASGRQHKSAA